MLRLPFTSLDNWRKRHWRRFVLDVIATATMIACGLMGIGLATLAAYDGLRATQGSVSAALILSAIYGISAFLIFTMRSYRRRAVQHPRNIAPVEACSNDVPDLLRSAMAAASGASRPEELAAGLSLGRALSPFESIAVALISGFLAGRRLGK